MTPRQRATWCAHMWKALTRRYHGELEPVFRPYIPPDGVVIDVGAHAGHFSKLFAKMCPLGRIHAFEPGSYALSILNTVQRLNRLSNVTIHPIALGDTDETAALHVPIKASGSFGFGLSFIGDKNAQARAVMTETVEVRRLDDVIAACEVSHVHFIKIDIEGSELRMLRGAEKTLRDCRPVIYMEVNSAYLERRGDDVDMLARFLKGLNYAPVGGWDIFPRDHNALLVPA